jgi:hypothetical protein
LCSPGFGTAELLARGLDVESQLRRVAPGAKDPKKCENVMRLFLRLAGISLGFAGLGKALSAIGAARALDTIDPLIGIPFRQLFLLVGLAELLIAFFGLFTDRRRFTLWAVAWLSTNFLLYRLGLWFIGWQHPCGGLGTLAGPLHLSDQAADNIMKGVLAFLLVGSYGILVSQWLRGRRAKGPPGGDAAGG